VLFKTFEAWVLLHAWLAFVLAWLWLRGRRLSPLASILGAAVFACGGYMVSQNVHVGVVTGYPWMPLAWLGMDEALESRSWRPMWKVVAPSALCFLAGYPASFAAFAVATVVYAGARLGAAASRRCWRSQPLSPSHTNRLFDISDDEELLRLLGVRYFVVRAGATFGSSEFQGGGPERCGNPGV
jgi:hypothetical protein